MKKLSFILAVALLLSIGLSACNNSGGSKNDPVITLAEDACTLNPGNTYQLSYTVEPEGTPVEYITSNPEVITVDNTGKITALKIGTASLAISAGEYSKAYFDVTVLPLTATSIPEIRLSSSSLELITGSEFDLCTEVRDGQKTIEGVPLTWASADTAVATVNDGKVTAVSPGKTVLTVTADVNGQKLETNCPVTVWDYYEIILNVDNIDAPMGNTIHINATIKNSDGVVIEPQEGDLEYITSDPTAITVEGNTFTIIGISNRIPSVGVKYKGNVASVPVKIFSVTADFFNSGTSNFTGEVDGVTFSGVTYKSSAYQPKFYLTQDGIDRIKAYAAEHGYSTLRMHCYSILFNNMFVLNNQVWIPNESWAVSDFSVNSLSTSFEFFSGSEGTTEIYMWFELV